MELSFKLQPGRLQKLTITAILVSGSLLFAGCHQSTTEQQKSGWGLVPEIEKKMAVPEFPDRDFLITDFGARGDSVTDSLPAIRNAIERCSGEGGGRIVVPEGTFLCNGPIHLKSNVHLYISKGAEIRFSGTPEHFLPVVLTRWEGTELYNYSPLIYAYQATNVAITGEGTINGSAKNSFAQWKPQQNDDQLKLRQMGNDGVALHERVFGDGHWLRPSMIQPFGCKNVLIEGVSLIDSPFWVIHPTYSTNVTVRNVTVESWNPNNDGCDPDSSVNVLIEDCVFNTGDDAVAIKSGRDQDGWRVGQATENVIIRNCDMGSKANGLCIGSEMSGGVRNVFMEDCHVSRAESTIYFKSNLDRGGIIEDVWVRNIDVDEAAFAFVRLESNYKGHRGNHYPPLFRNLSIEQVTCKVADQYGIYAEGHPDSYLEDTHLKNIKVESASVPLHLRFARNLVLSNVSINGQLLPTYPEMTADTRKESEMSW